MGKYMDLDLSDEVIGIEALQKIHAEGPRRHQLGLIMEEEEPMRPGFVWNDIMFEGNKIGDLTNNVWSRRLEKILDSPWFQQNPTWRRGQGQP